MPYADEDFSSELQQFITSIRLRALQDTAYECCTDSQARRLAIAIKSALKDPTNRIKVLEALTGLPINSQNELTFHMHQILIDELKEPEDGTLLREVEALIEEEPDCRPVDLFPWYRLVP